MNRAALRNPKKSSCLVLSGHGDIERVGPLALGIDVGVTRDVPETRPPGESLIFPAVPSSVYSTYDDL